jgi:hypothetical protein
LLFQRAGRNTDVTPKRLPIKRHPWEKILAHFVESPEELTLKELGEAYGIPYQSMRERSSDHKWTLQRAQYQANLAQKRSNERVKRAVKDATDFDDQSLRAAQIGQSLVAGRMAQIAELFAASQAQHQSAVAELKQGNPVTRADTYSVINYRELGELAKALSLFQDVGRKALGTDINRFEIDGAVQHTADVQVSIVQEMASDDIDRQAALLDAMQRAGLIKLTIEPEDIQDVELIGEDEQQQHQGEDDDDGDGY